MLTFSPRNLVPGLPGNMYSFFKVGLIILMYFTYCQLWIYLVIRSFYIEYVKKEARVWDKTVRFDIATEKQVK